MSQPNLLLLQIEPHAWNEVLFKPWTDHQWRLVTKFFDFSLLFRSFVKSTSHIFVRKIAFVLHHIKIFPKAAGCFFLIGWAFWAWTTKVFVFRGYLSRVNWTIKDYISQAVLTALVGRKCSAMINTLDSMLRSVVFKYSFLWKALCESASY